MLLIHQAELVAQEEQSDDILQNLSPLTVFTLLMATSCYNLTSVPNSVKTSRIPLVGSLLMGELNGKLHLNWFRPCFPPDFHSVSNIHIIFPSFLNIYSLQGDLESSQCGTIIFSTLQHSLSSLILECDCRGAAGDIHIQTKEKKKYFFRPKIVFIFTA